MRHDSTLRRRPTIVPTGHGVTIGPLHPAHSSGRSIFPGRVFDPHEVKRVLKDGHQNRKIGRQVRKGRRRGWPIYTLTLEERATCPRACVAWSYCYGNTSQAAERLVAGPELEEALWAELAQLQASHPAGFLVSLHILGDFYSIDYVTMWELALGEFPALHVFGFTARDADADPIGRMLHDMACATWDRFAIRFSGREGPMMASRIIDHGQDSDPEAITCPAQTGKSQCCATCMLCVYSERSIAFARH